MRSFDLSPLFRSTVGFDHLNHLLETAARADEASVSYPPYNIEKHSDDHYRITMAVAGFAESDLTLTAEGSTLTISGKLTRDEAKVEFLHRGIAGRSFERRFQLADHIKVGGASLVNGLLSVDLVREIPEAMKPRTIKIDAAPDAKLIESKAA
ncbi:heat-shock protein [Paramagnetospirillum kuznetsovii]|uniref:Heat-shock protein n=1 Tax=Paramagnetospirillum kuznetsovii TaxID=2053833 RepID=A0A364P3Y7_9PROT|nr:Hsp20 family protein [Paramagnetospirillum kuznetsovii]RAU24043.1 heat-shock protein [Paramagnetospirillum kuznetsovii]